MRVLCVSKLCVSKLCVRVVWELCVRVLCVGELCVSKLCVGELCVSELRVRELCVCVDHLHRCKTSFWLFRSFVFWFNNFFFQFTQGDGVCFRCLHPTKTHLLHSDMDWGRSIHVPAQSFSFSSMATG